MTISPDLIRSGYIWWAIKDLIEKSDMTISSISEKIWSSRPTVNNLLNGRTKWTDSFFSKIMWGVWLSDREIAEIFKKADQEEYKFKYWEDINALKDVDFDVMLSREYWIDDQDSLNDIKKFIEFTKNKS